MSHAEHGRHIRAALSARLAAAEVEAANTGAEIVYTAMRRTAPNPDDVRQLFEQIGVLYGRAQEADAFTRETFSQQGDEDGMAVQQLADFLDTVGRALRNTGGGTAAALRAALQRYEAVRNPDSGA